MGGDTAGGTGGPLEAGTRGNADPPVPIGKVFSGCAVGVTKGMRGVASSPLGSIPIRCGGIVRGAVSGTLAAGAGGTGCACGVTGDAADGLANGGATGGGRTGSTLAVSVARPA